MWADISLSDSVALVEWLHLLAFCWVVYYCGKSVINLPQNSQRRLWNSSILSWLPPPSHHHHPRAPGGIQPLTPPPPPPPTLHHPSTPPFPQPHPWTHFTLARLWGKAYGCICFLWRCWGCLFLWQQVLKWLLHLLSTSRAGSVAQGALILPKICFNTSVCFFLKSCALYFACCSYGLFCCYCCF